MYNLIDYGNKYIEKNLIEEEISRNSLTIIDARIKEKIKLREDFSLSKDKKFLNSLKNLRIKDTTSIIQVTYEINKR